MVLGWPSYSQTFSFIENLWTMLKSLVCDRKPTSRHLLYCGSVLAASLWVFILCVLSTVLDIPLTVIAKAFKRSVVKGL